MHLVRVKPLGNVYWAKSYCQITDHILQIEGLVFEVICVQLDYNFILKKEKWQIQFVISKPKILLAELLVSVVVYT